jgi:mannose-6-phosphate isomerase
MIDTVDWRVPAMGAVISLHDQLLGWLRDCALPLWDRHGVDRVAGGYFETLAVDSAGGLACAGGVRRGRVVARHLYAFDVGHRIGWESRVSNPVEHGRAYLFAHLYGGDGLFHTAVHADSRLPAEPFSLYEHAFYLFALARLAAASDAGHSVRSTALLCLDRLRGGWGKVNGGFDEANPPLLPLKSNPHMHLLESALAWIEVSEGAARHPWIELARELVTLCMTSFVDPRSGAIREYFDHEWRPAPGTAGRILEPGHQFEWAWLLFEWAASGHVDGASRKAAAAAALRLIEVGEGSGVDQVRGVAINEIWDDMTVKDANAKLWPQTERLKAWCARLVNSRGLAEAELACRKIAAAARGLWQYLCVEPAGLWHEVLTAEGSFAPGPSKASSFYHVVCAIDVLRQTVARGGMPLAPARP